MMPWTYLNGERVQRSARKDLIDPNRVGSSHFSPIAASAVARSIFVMLRLRHRVKLDGELPRSGGCVLVSKHETYWDSIYPGALSHAVVPIVSTVAQGKPAMRWFFGNYGVIWADARSITKAASIVAGGRVVWLAPQGFANSRHGTSYEKPRLGAARIAKLTNRPVVTLIMTIQHRRWRRPILHLVIGPSLWPIDGESSRQFTTRFMTHLGRD